MELDEFEELWTSPPGRYALLRAESEDGVLLPLDLEHKAAVLIDEDDALAEAVISRMLEAGVPVLNRPPW